MKKFFRAVTLLELLIAIVLLSIVVLAIGNIQIFSRYHVITADRRAKLQNEASFALEHITKNIGKAIGNRDDWPVKIYNDANGIMVRIDSNGSGRTESVNITAVNSTTNVAYVVLPADKWIAYRRSGSTILYYPDAGSDDFPIGPAGSSEIIANHVLASSGGLVFGPGSAREMINQINASDATRTDYVPVVGFTDRADGTGLVHDNTINATLIVRWDTNPFNETSQDKPEVNMSAKIKMPSVSTH